jgi:hypothetical protein
VKTGLGAHQAARVSRCINAVGPDQALTSQSLQQVAEGLMCLTNEEMKHWFKDWLVFDSQVIYYIAWKLEWWAYHQENYPGMQGDALRKPVHAFKELREKIYQGLE